MITSILKISGILLLVGLLAGCQSMTGQTAGEHIDDAGITASVKAKLTNHQVSSLGRIGVETINREVRLTGIVKSSADKAEATRLASEVNGVKRVTNNLRIQPE